MKKLTVATLLMAMTIAGGANAATWSPGDPTVVTLDVSDTVTLNVNFTAADVSSKSYEPGAAVGGYLTAKTGEPVNAIGWKWEETDGLVPAEGLMTSTDGTKIHVKLINDDGTDLPENVNGYAANTNGSISSMKVRYVLTDDVAPKNDKYDGAVLTVVFV